MATEATFKVETSVKVPPRVKERGPFAKAILALKPGQSLLVKGKNLRNAQAHAHSYIGAGKYAVRKVDGGARIWKLK